MKFCVYLMTFCFALFGRAQKINTDSLLVKANAELNRKNYLSAITLAKIGLKEAPDYLDFHITLGRAYFENKALDSAAFHFDAVVRKNPSYRDAFTYAIRTALEQGKIDASEKLCDTAQQRFPDDKEFEFLRIDILEKKGDDSVLLSYLEMLIKKYPKDDKPKILKFALLSKIRNDRIGINYVLTYTNRENVGPFQLGALQYIRERKKLTLIGTLHYADRFYNGQSAISGLQYEIESYFPNTAKIYSYAGAAVSGDALFPKIRLAYSCFYNFGKGWETDLGLRYVKSNENELLAVAAGAGKYIANYWLNFRTYLQTNDEKVFATGILTMRYYFDIKYNYVTLYGGFGTSPDEHLGAAQFSDRIALNSWHAGAGYYRLILAHFYAGIQFSLNNLEYKKGFYQNEAETFLQLQYKF